MKTLAETKKGLKCCYSPVEALFRCEGCPYQGSVVCKMSLHNDAFEHIERLEAKNEAYKQSAINCCYESRCNARIKELEDLCGRLVDEKEKLERGRNAAMDRIGERKREIAAREMSVVEKSSRIDEINKCMEILHRLPYADAEPVRHGENVSPAHYSDEFTCSACGFSCEITELRYDDEDGYGMGTATQYEYDCKYCPECGAKMDGGKKNEH